MTDKKCGDIWSENYGLLDLPNSFKNPIFIQTDDKYWMAYCFDSKKKKEKKWKQIIKILGEK